MNRIFSLVTVAVMLAAVIVKKPQEELSGQAYVLIEASTCAVLEGKNVDQIMSCGYLSKLMSLLLVAEDIEAGELSLDEEIAAPQEVYGTKGAVVWLEPGDKMTVEELLKSVIIGNANDAMIALACACEGSQEEFVSRMNSEAFDLGLRDTAFYGCCGYRDDRDHTTARELAVICARLSGYDLLRPYFATWRDFVRSGQTELVSENTLSRTYDRHIGFKACHFEEEGYSVAEGGQGASGSIFIAVVLGAPDAENSLKTAKTLVNRGFSDYKVTATVFPEEMILPLKVKGGRELAVELGIAGQSSLVIPRSVGEVRTVTVIPDYINAPVEKGQRLGTAAFYSGDSLVFETDIVAKADVPELSYLYALKKLLCDL
ncbi:MAG: D-alanyl-D-alanine carboxypeptidase [Ruminococcus sp.]|nr:D-alanyl-D-alanine carboxypeptidase [Ruminococcus sp.]